MGDSRYVRCLTHITFRPAVNSVLESLDSPRVIKGTWIQRPERKGLMYEQANYWERIYTY